MKIYVVAEKCNSDNELHLVNAYKDLNEAFDEAQKFDQILRFEDDEHPTIINTGHVFELELE